MAVENKRSNYLRAAAGFGGSALFEFAIGLNILYKATILQGPDLKLNLEAATMEYLAGVLVLAIMAASAYGSIYFFGKYLKSENNDTPEN